MSDNKPLDLSTLNVAIHLDATVGSIGLTSMPEAGAYDAKVIEAGYTSREGRVSLALTLSFAGSRTYTYLPLPTDPNAEKFDVYQRAFNRFLTACGFDLGGAKGAVDGNWLKNALATQPSTAIYFYPPHRKPDGGYDNATQEITFLSGAEKAEVAAGTLTINRRLKPREAALPGIAGMGVSIPSVLPSVGAAAPVGVVPAAAAITSAPSIPTVPASAPSNGLGNAASALAALGISMPSAPPAIG